MDNQHKKIKGYRELNQFEIDCMNGVKELSEEIGELIFKLKGVESFDSRWIDIGTTDLQTGIMALVRSIARPTTF